MRLLVQNNAAIDPVDLDGYTPLHLASASKTASPNIVTILLEAGASTTHKGTYTNGYDVRTGRGGVSPNEDKVKKVA